VTWTARKVATWDPKPLDLCPATRRGRSLTSDNKPAHDDQDEDFVGESHAADEPTAVWDEKSLRAAGLSDILGKRPSEPPLPPATPAGGMTQDPSIVVDTTIGPNARPQASAPEQPAELADARPNGMGWPTTVGIAVGLGALVYIVIRLLKG
jgi:hypothetical protein